MQQTDFKSNELFSTTIMKKIYNVLNTICDMLAEKRSIKKSLVLPTSNNGKRMRREQTEDYKARQCIQSYGMIVCEAKNTYIYQYFFHVID